MHHISSTPGVLIIPSYPSVTSILTSSVVQPNDLFIHSECQWSFAQVVSLLKEEMKSCDKSFGNNTLYCLPWMKESTISPLLWLSMPNIMLTHAAFFSDSCLLHAWHTNPSFLCFSFVITTCHMFALPFCHCHVVTSCFLFFSISWLCLMHTTTSCYYMPEHARTLSVDLIQICTYILW